MVVAPARPSLGQSQPRLGLQAKCRGNPELFRARSPMKLWSIHALPWKLGALGAHPAH